MDEDKQQSNQYISEGLKGWKRFLPLINIALFVGVVTLGVIGVFLYCAVPSPLAGLKGQKSKGPAEPFPVPTIQSDVVLQEEYDLLASENPFAPSREEWRQQRVPQRDNITGEVKKKAPNIPPQSIALYGIAITENMKKALVKNPDPIMHGSEPFLYIEEGGDVGGYKVKSIEPKRIKLEWEGQEFVIDIFADKGNTRGFPAPSPATYRQPSQPSRQEDRGRYQRDRDFPPGRSLRSRADEEEWDEDDDWDEEDWDEEEWEEDWDEDEEWYGEEEEWDEDYERRGPRSRSYPRKSSRRSRRR